ncbi:hypothetical protein [Streptomyces tailanensis]|uniref:hypothetical protein n=1 Tax=Streptomyces tailanensis TaxID=2569858 RepID=UPI001C0F0CC1|nr:hypothetical protein [Streptomyces tailanensis]
MYEVGEGETPATGWSIERSPGGDGRFAEELRRRGADVRLSVGCEFWLFVPECRLLSSAAAAEQRGRGQKWQVRSGRSKMDRELEGDDHERP